MDELQHAKASATDGFLCKLVSAERLCHGVGQRLYLSDPGSSTSLRDPGTLGIIDEFQSQFDCLPLGKLNPLENGEFLQYATYLFF